MSKVIHHPAKFLQEKVDTLNLQGVLDEYEKWWYDEGEEISEYVDKAGTPHLKQFDEKGRRIDEIQYPPDYWRMLWKGYELGVIWRVFEMDSVKPFYLIGYITGFWDPGLACPYTVSISTAVPLSKYGSPDVKEKYLPKLLEKKKPWQGATWMTEIKGGSDLGWSVETVAEKTDGGKWILNGEKYFSSNVGAETAVVAGRPKGAPRNVRGLALYFVPKFKGNGELNYFVRRLKPKIATRSVPTGEVEFKNTEAYLLGSEEGGIYLILEVLNISRVANAFFSVAGIQRAISLAVKYANERYAFGKMIAEHPLLKKEIEERTAELERCFRIGWEAVELLDKVWKQKPKYSQEYHTFRLMSHIAKYWTAEKMIETSKWAMEVWAGIGTLHEFPVERLLREAMIIAIWEGTRHRHLLDGLEVMERKKAHISLAEYLKEKGYDLKKIQKAVDEVEKALKLPQDEKEKATPELFKNFVEIFA